MKIAVMYDDTKGGMVEVRFDLDKKGVERVEAEYNRRGWDADSWAVVIDTDKQTYEEYWVQYDERMD